MFATPGRLRHGLDADGARPARRRPARRAAWRMCEVLRRAVAAEQAAARRPVAIALDAVTVEIGVRPARTARDRARGTGLPHNRGAGRSSPTRWSPSSSRAAWTDHRWHPLPIPTTSTCSELDDYAADPAESAAAIERDLAADLRGRAGRCTPTCRPRSVELWPLRTPEQLLADLLSSPDSAGRLCFGVDPPAPAPPGRRPLDGGRTRRCWTSSPSCSARLPRRAAPARADGRPARSRTSWVDHRRARP